MGQVNIHSYRPRTLGGILCLILSYVPPLIAFGLMMLIMLPYYSLYCHGSLWRQLSHRPPLGTAGNDHDVPGGPSYVATLWFLFCVSGSSFFFGCVLVSFWKCLFTPPGYVSDVPWAEEPMMLGGTNDQQQPIRRLEEPRPMHTVTQFTRNSKPRFCTPCGIFKPDDAHHCHDCGRCVERMDHHCPWINNCVGLETEKYFILFLLYISLTGLFVSATLGYGLRSGGVSVLTTVFLVMDLIGAAVFAVAMMGFVGFHLSMVYKGMTTIDYVVAKRTGVAVAAASAAKRQQVLASVFGVDRRWWVVLLPLAPKRPNKENEMHSSSYV